MARAFHGLYGDDRRNTQLYGSPRRGGSERVREQANGDGSRIRIERHRPVECIREIERMHREFDATAREMVGCRRIG